MDAAWVDSTVQALKANPDLFKGMFKGRGAALGIISTLYVYLFLLRLPTFNLDFFCVRWGLRRKY